MLSCGACQWQWDTLGEAWPLVGAPVSVGFPINTELTDGALVFTDREGRPYAAYGQPKREGELEDSSSFAVTPLYEGGRPTVRLNLPNIVVGARVFYARVYASEPPTMSANGWIDVYELDQLPTPRRIPVTLTSAEPEFIVSYGDELLANFPNPGVANTFSIVRLTTGEQVEVPYWDAFTPSQAMTQSEMVFSSRNEWLLVRDSNAQVRLIPTPGSAASSTIFFDKQGGVLWADDDRQALLQCGVNGLRAIAYDKSATRVLDARPCNPTRTTVWLTDVYAYYTVTEGEKNELDRVVLDGGALPERVTNDPERILDLVRDSRGNEHVISTRDSSARYVNDSSDGFIDGWHFMERGRLPRLVRDATQIYWLEHAAQDTNAGDLLMADVGGASQRVAYNAVQLDEVRDGRLVALTNAAYAGVHNRIVLLDPDRREQRHVVDNAQRYTRIPTTNELLVERYANAGSSLFNLYRVAIPAAENSPGGGE